MLALVPMLLSSHDVHPCLMGIPISRAQLSPFLIPRATVKKVSQGHLAAQGTQETG